MKKENPRMRIKQELVDEAARRGHTITSLLEHFLNAEQTQAQALSLSIARLSMLLSTVIENKLPSKEDITFLRILKDEYTKPQ